MINPFHWLSFEVFSRKLLYCDSKPYSVILRPGLQILCKLRRIIPFVISNLLWTRLDFAVERSHEDMVEFVLCQAVTDISLVDVAEYFFETAVKPHLALEPSVRSLQEAFTGSWMTVACACPLP